MRRGALGLVAVAALGCAEPRWDVESLERRHPELRGHGAHRLGDSTPYYLPAAGRLTLFLCRWADRATVRVSLPADASPEERSKLETALAAWEGALGLRFELGDFSGVGIEIRLIDDMLAYSANTVADCAVDAEALGASEPAVLPARLVSASIHIARDDPRLAGTALHELGHALGFQGHARRGRTVMVSSTSAIREAGERVMGGRAFEDAALGALYAVPSGTVVKRLTLPSGRTAPVDGLLALGRQGGLIGPLVRVGDHEGRVAWLEPDGRVLAVLLSGLRQALRAPARLRIEPSARAREALGKAS
jgi:hypothetical protein